MIAVVTWLALLMLQTSPSAGFVSDPSDTATGSTGAEAYCASLDPADAYALADSPEGLAECEVVEVVEVVQDSVPVLKVWDICLDPAYVIAEVFPDGSYRCELYA